MSKLIAILIALIWLVIPNHALSKAHDGENQWSTECTAVWAKNKANATEAGTIIDLDYESMKAFAKAATLVPPVYLPPADYLKAFADAKVAYLMHQNRSKVAYWIGIWDFETCMGAVITLPKPVYNYILKLMGQII